MKIHPNIESARAALAQYRDAVNILSEQLGVYETCEDTCCPVYAQTRYYSADGKINSLSDW
jgi:hypothetical protein